MVDKADVEARYQKCLAVAKQMEQEVLILAEAGISRESVAFKAFEREVRKAADEYAVVAEMRQALGTLAEESVAKYGELSMRAMRLRDALHALFEAGIAPGSTIHRLVEEEEDGVHADLEKAAAERDQARSK